MNELKPIQERIEELKKEGKEKKAIVNILYTEGYKTKSIMMQGYSLRSLKTTSTLEDDDIQKTIAGAPGKGPGYIAEWKELVRRQMSRSRQLTEVFYDLGLTVLMASLAKSGLTTEDYRKIFADESSLREALMTAAQTSFKALEYFEADAMTNLERERDNARAAYALLETEISKLSDSLDPKLRLEKMVYNLILTSGSTNIDPNALTALINKWVDLEITLPQTLMSVMK